ncbi:class I SAM-dependent methyltransferase [Streptomyces sparsus]
MPELDYEPFALQYDRGSAENPFNTLLERPALRALMGSTRGLRVLEAGCAGGRLTGQLVDEGAEVVALDASPTLVRLAAERVGPRAAVRVHDLRQPLDFQPSGSIDLVVCSLTLHYLRDWRPVLAEFRRVLSPGGRVVVSTHHPFGDLELSTSGDYFGVEQLTDEWTSYGPPPMVVRYYRRPLSSMLADARQAGLSLTDLREPRVGEEHRAAFGRKFDKVATEPWFLLLEFTARSEDRPSPARPFSPPEVSP